MNKEDFKKLVRPYIIKGDSANKDLILQDFKSLKNEEIYIKVENKLLFIPSSGYTIKSLSNPDGFNQIMGTFVYSENSKMYCWASGYKEYTDAWYETDFSSGWDPEYRWILRNQPMSDMNEGQGWNFGEAQKTYYVLEIPEFKFMNWVLRYPLNLK